MADNTITMNVVLKLVDDMSGHVRAAVDNSKKSLDNFAEHAQRIGSELKSIGRDMAAVGIGITAALGTTVKQFADLEQGLAQLKSTMTSKDGLSANFQKVSDLAVKLGNELPGNTRDFAVMINKLLQLGITEEAVLGGVGEAAAKLAVVMKLPFEEAATIAAKLKEATGTSQEDMLKFMDTIQRVGHQGVLASEMMYAFARSGGALKQFGIQGEEAGRQVATLFAQVIKSGISGETAGTALTSVFNRLLQFSNQSTGPAKEAAAQLKELGIQLEFFDEKSGEFKGVENMVAQFDKLRELNTSQRGAVLQNIFGGGQDQQIVALLTQGGTAANQAMAAAMANQADLATRSAVQLQTLSAKWEAAFGTFQNLLAKIGELLAPKLGEFVDWFGRVSADLQKWIDENKGLAETLTVVLGALGTGLTALGAAGLTAGAIATAFGAVAAGLSAIAGAATAVAPALAALAANPVALVILTGVGAFAFGTWINDQITKAATAFSGVEGMTLGTVIADWVEAAQAGLGKLPAIFKNAFAATLKAIRDHFQSFVEAGKFIIDGLINGIKAKATEVIDKVKGLGNDVIKSVRDVLGIKSPSEVMADLGRQTAAGFALGLTLGTAQVTEAATNMANQVPTVAVAAAQAAQASELQYLNATIQYRKLNLDSANFFFSQLGALMQTKSKALFQIGKAAAIAETIIDTYRAAQKAYAAMAGIPFVGPALGAAAAAAAVAAGLARVQAIRSTDMGGASGSPVLSGGGFSGPVISSGASVAVPAAPVNAPQPAAPAREINIYLRGNDVFSAQAVRESLIPALNEALGDGVILNVRTA